MLTYLSQLEYMSMVMVCHLSNQEGLVHIHNQMENCLEVHLIEDPLEEDHIIKTQLEYCHLIHMLDFMDG
jgi:hypothetical protein